MLKEEPKTNLVRITQTKDGEANSKLPRPSLVTNNYTSDNSLSAYSNLLVNYIQ